MSILRFKHCWIKGLLLGLVGLLLLSPALGGTSQQATETFENVLVTGKLTVKGLLELAGLSPPRASATPTTGGTLEPGTYTYQVTAFNAVGETTGIPLKVEVRAPNNAVELSWEEVEGALGYRIYRDGGQIAEVEADETEFTDTGLARDPTKSVPQANTTGGNTKLEGDLSVGGVVTVGGLTFLQSNVEIGMEGQWTTLTVLGDEFVYRVNIGAAATAPTLPLNITPLAAAIPAGVRLDSSALGGRVWHIEADGDFTIADLVFPPDPGFPPGVERLKITGPGGDITLNLGDPGDPANQIPATPGIFNIADLAIGEPPRVTVFFESNPDAAVIRLDLGVSAGIGEVWELRADPDFTITDVSPFLGQTGVPDIDRLMIDDKSIWFTSGDPVYGNSGGFYFEDEYSGADRLKLDRDAQFEIGDIVVVKEEEEEKISYISGHFTILDIGTDGYRFIINEQGHVGIGVSEYAAVPSEGDEPGRTLINCSLGVGTDVKPPLSCGDVEIGGDSSIAGNVRIGEVEPGFKLGVGGDALINADLVVEGESRLKEDLFVSGELAVAKDARMDTNLSVGGTLKVVEDAQIYGNLSVDRGLLKVARDIEAGGNIIAKAQLITQQISALSPEQPVQLTGSLNVSKDVDIDGGLRIDGTITGLTPDVGLVVKGGGAQLLRWLTVGDPTVAAPHAAGIGDVLASGNIVASGQVQASKLCIGEDCRTEWPKPGEFDFSQADRRYVLKPRDETDLTIGSLMSLGQLAGDWLAIGEPATDENFWSLINPDNGPDLALGVPNPDDLSRLDLTVMEFERATGNVRILKDLTVEGLSTLEDLRVYGDTDLGDLIARDAEFDYVTVYRDLEVKGLKYFVQPDPTDPGRVIAYASLEGPEAGTYLRGEAQLVSGEAVIVLPEHFALVTSEEGLTVQLTPIGEWLQLYVVELSPQRLVVREAQGKDGRFFYLIQGVRKGYEDFQPVQEKE